MRTLNLGILAHVDAGKTTLTERLLCAAGVIDAIGSVDDGTTQTDTLALERQRGITIKSAVVSFAVGDVTVNLIDTPGHPDFIAEVERVLGVLDGAVLVVSAVEGVQAQTRVLLRTLRRLGIPTIIFINKIDRAGAAGGRVLGGVADRLSPAVIAMGAPRGEGTRGADYVAYGPTDRPFVARLAELVAEHDDAVLADYLADEAGLSYDRLMRRLAAQSRSGLVHPVFYGSAVTGAGVGQLTDALTELLPAADRQADAEGPVSAAVFKVERGSAGEKVAYARMFAGTLRARDVVDIGARGRGRVTAISVFGSGGAGQSAQATAGQIAKLRGLSCVKVGDVLGEPRAWYARHHFAPPSFETVVVPSRPADKGAVHAALTQLAEQDPLINLRQDEVRSQLLVSLYGEVHKEVIGATLADEFGLQVGFEETMTIHIERPTGTGAAVEFMGGVNPFRATVGLRIDPAPIGSGVSFGLEIELGALPMAFIKAVEETVRQTLTQGLRGWQVTDASVALTHSGYTPPPPYGWSKWSSSAGDFRNLTPLVLMSALSTAGTQVYEPVHRFSVEMPADALGAVVPVLARLLAVPLSQAAHGSLCTVEGEGPAASVHRLRQALPALTRGEGVLESAFDHYELARGEIPVRARSGSNPLNRKDYLLRMARGVAGP